MSEKLMREALIEAKKAFLEGEVPVGALVVKDGNIIAKAYNKVESLKDPTAHAEILALREAGIILNTPNLSGCELVVTLEPCAMCAGALIVAKITTLIFGAMNKNFGAVKTHTSLLDLDSFNHKVKVIPSVLEEETSQILSDFFEKMRNKNL